MRRLLIALLFVFASLPVAGVNTVVVMRHAAAAGGGGDLLAEGFEGTGYENTWAETGTGSIDEDETSTCSAALGAAFQGSQCLLMTIASTETGGTLQEFSAGVATDVYVRFHAKITYAMNDAQEIVIAGLSDVTEVGGNGMLLAIIRFGANYEISLRGAGDTEIAYATAPASGETHCYEFMMNNTTNAWEWWIDGSQTGLINASGTYASLTMSPSHLWFAGQTVYSPGNLTLVIDDVDVSTTGPLGCS